MAIVTSPGMGTGARNKLAGVVFATWRGLTYMRSLRIPQNPRSPGQIRARRLWWCASMQWKALMPVWKGYFDQLASLHVPLTDDLGPMPSGISGTYTGYNLHRFAYMRGIVPDYWGMIYSFLLEVSPDRFSFSFKHNALSTVPDVLARVWYAVRPFNAWNRATGQVTYMSASMSYIAVASPIGIPAGTTGADMLIAFDFRGPPLDGWPHTLAGSSLPDGHFAPILEDEPTQPQPLTDPCIIPA